jgi:hypothetical protein
VGPIRRTLGNTLQGNDDWVREGKCRVDADYDMVDQRVAMPSFWYVHPPRGNQAKARERALVRTKTSPRTGPGLIQALLNLANLACGEVQKARLQPKRPFPSLRTSDLSDEAIKNAFVAPSLTVGSGSFWK